MLGSPATGAVFRVVDLGAGTGKGTRAIAALGHEVIAVEPSDGMREALTTSLASLPQEVAGRIATLAGGAEDIPVQTCSVDAVTVFQAWHWFDPETAAAECARILRPGGWLSMGWHVRSEHVGWSRELSDISSSVVRTSLTTSRLRPWGPNAADMPRHPRYRHFFRPNAADGPLGSV